MKKEAYSDEAKSLVRHIHKLKTLAELEKFFEGLKGMFYAQKITWHELVYVSHIIEEQEKRVREANRILRNNPGRAARRQNRKVAIANLYTEAKKKKIENFKCEVCGGIHKSGWEINGKKVCPACSKQLTKSAQQQNGDIAQILMSTGMDPASSEAQSILRELRRKQQQSDLENKADKSQDQEKNQALLDVLMSDSGQDMSGEVAE